MCHRMHLGCHMEILERGKITRKNPDLFPKNSNKNTPKQEQNSQQPLPYRFCISNGAYYSSTCKLNALFFISIQYLETPH